MELTADSLRTCYVDAYEQPEEMWFTIDTAFTKLIIAPTIQHETHIMNLILDSLKVENNACFAFMQQPVNCSSHKLYSMSFTIWITGKLFQITLRTSVMSTHQIVRDCHSLLLSHFIPDNLPLYVILLQRHINFAKEVIECHKKIANLESQFIVKAFNAFWLLPPTLRNRSNLIVLRSRKNTSAIIDVFLWVLESHSWCLFLYGRTLLPEILPLLLDVMLLFKVNLMARAFMLVAQIIPLVISSKEVDWKVVVKQISGVLLKLSNHKRCFAICESVSILAEHIVKLGGTQIPGLNSKLLELIFRTLFALVANNKRKNKCFKNLCFSAASLMEYVSLSDESTKIILKLADIGPSYKWFLKIFKRHILLTIQEKLVECKCNVESTSGVHRRCQSVINISAYSIIWCKLLSHLETSICLLKNNHPIHINNVTMRNKYISQVNSILKVGFQIKYALNAIFPESSILLSEHIGRKIAGIVNIMCFKQCQTNLQLGPLNICSCSLLLNSLMPIAHHHICALIVIKVCVKIWRQLKLNPSVEIYGFSMKYLFCCLLIALVFLSRHKKYRKIAHCTLKNVLYYVQESDTYKYFIEIVPTLIMLADDLKLVKDLLHHISQMFKTGHYLDDLFFSPHSGKQLTCILANRCILERVDNITWNIKCIDCDFEVSPRFNPNINKTSVMACYLNTVGLKFRDLILNSPIELQLILVEYLPRFMRHSNVLNTLFVMEQLSTIMQPPICKLHSEYIKNMNGFLISCDGSVNKVGSFALIKAISALMKYITINADIKWLNYILQMIIRIGQLRKDWSLLVSTKIVFLLGPTISLFSEEIIPEILQSIFGSHTITIKELLTQFQEDLSKIWVTLLVFDAEARKFGVEYTLDLISDVFALSARDFLELYCTYTLVSYLTTTFHEETAVYILNRLSTIFDMPLKDLLIIYFEDTFTRIYFYENKDKMKQMLKFVEDYTHETIGTIIYFSFKTLICKVLAHSCNPKVVHFIITETMHKPASSCEIIQLLEQHVLGYLTYIDTKLVSSRTSEVTLKKCLSSLPDVAYFIGPLGVTNIRVKFLDTLRTGLPPHYRKYPKLAMRAWAYFIYSVDLSLIGPFLSTIFVSILPLMEMFPKDVTTIFYYLTVNNREIFLEQLPELYFVPKVSTQVMNLVRNSIQKSLKKDCYSYKEDILATLKYIQNDNKELRIHALNKLCKLLKVYSKTLYEVILQNDMLDPLILEIIDCLMVNLRDPNLDVQMACGKCIGELGAIDPSRIENTIKEGSAKLMIFNIQSDEFAQFCMTEMIKGLHNATDPLRANVFASCIQELLKIYFGAKPEAICKFLLKFPPHLRDVLESLMRARYRYLGSSFRDDYPDPIFRSPLGGTISDWAFTWSTQLVTFIDSQSFSQKVLSACCPCLALDMKTLLSFLPYILLEALLTCSSQQSHQIEKEMKTVLHWNEQSVNSSYKIPDINERKLSLEDDDNPQRTFLKLGLDDVKCINIIFDLLDYLSFCLSEGVKTSEKTINQSIISSFLNRFPHQKMSNLSYQQKDYCRSLLYMERELSNKDENFCLHPLRCIYSKLNDPDGLLGVMRIFPGFPNTEDTILSHIVSGKVEDAVIGYETLSEKYDNIEFSRGLVQCYLSMDQPYVALQVTKALYYKSSFVAPNFCNEMIEVLWKNVLIDDLDKMLDLLDEKMKDNWCWGVDVGTLISNFCQRNEKKMNLKILEMRRHLVENLAVICDTSNAVYRQGYSHIVKLQVLNEFEKYISTIKIMSELDGNKFNEILGKSLDLRLELLPRDNHVLQRIISMRRVSLCLLRKKAVLLNNKAITFIDVEIGQTWLKSAKFARKSGNFRKAYAMIEMGEHYSPIGLFLEKAKLHRAKCDTSSAILTLEQGISQYFPDGKSISSIYYDNKMLCAEAKLLLAKYNDENTNVNFHEGYQYYKEAVDICSWEKGFVYLAQYLFKIISTSNLLDVNKVERDIQVVTASYFGRSLLYGSQYIYQSMPCMLSLWFDFGTRLTYGGSVNLDERYKTMAKFNTLIEKFIAVLPTYIFMTAFTQILSRINHPEASCFKVLRKIIVNIISAFPQQAMWMFISVLKSKNDEHAKRSAEVIREAKIRKNKELVQFISAFGTLADLLIQLCGKQNKSMGVFVNIDTLCKGLRSFIKDYPSIMIPAQRFRTISLPNYVENGKGITKLNHEPFPRIIAYLCDVKKNVQILKSLQRPKKIDFIGSDGIVYPIMCKSMDDLRLDSRIMEFNSIVNMYLRRDTLSRDRDLHIHTYSVVPLNHQSGLIEWVRNLDTYRHIVNSMYKDSKHFMSMQEIKNISLGINEPLSEKIRVFMEKLLPRHPAVFHLWFFMHFSNPDSWYRARTSYIRTTAVMSIVGYIVGLGDRHGENILLDTTCGDVVHVDFNCLFNKGECFSFPEVVPFRLTHNMVKAMGPTGTEGPFVHSCEITNRILRSHRDELLAVIKPFMYDPLELSRKQVPTIPFQEGHADLKVRTHIKRVEKRLNGIVNIRNNQDGPALSVEGQVRCLIEEATDINNLCQMYFGWGAYF